MNTFYVYQPILTDKQHTEVNANGWAGCEWAGAYMNITALYCDEGEVIDRVVAAINAELYQHSYTVEADNINDVFSATNGMGGGKIIFRSGNQKSGSVGDVIIAADQTEGWVCMPCGWKHLVSKACKWFEDQVWRLHAIKENV